MNINEMIEALTIFGNAKPELLDSGYFLAAEHDQIFVYLTGEDIAPDSAEGKRLDELGWYCDGDGWSSFV